MCCIKIASALVFMPRSVAVISVVVIIVYNNNNNDSNIRSLKRKKKKRKNYIKYNIFTIQNIFLNVHN